MPLTELRDDFCLTTFKILSVLHVPVRLVLKFLGFLVEEKNNFKILLASMKTLTNSMGYSITVPCLFDPWIPHPKPIFFRA
jgi:hypothetical protein